MQFDEVIPGCPRPDGTRSFICVWRIRITDVVLVLLFMYMHMHITDVVLVLLFMYMHMRITNVVLVLLFIYMHIRITDVALVLLFMCVAHTCTHNGCGIGAL